MDYLLLDLLGTFRFVPHPNLRKLSRSWQRASYTIGILRLNERDPLIRARRSAYDSYKRYIGDYIRLRNDDDDRSLETLIVGLKGQAHPTVWREMKRQSTIVPELASLFTQAPEALNW